MSSASSRGREPSWLTDELALLRAVQDVAPSVRRDVGPVAWLLAAVCALVPGSREVPVLSLHRCGLHLEVVTNQQRAAPTLA